MIIFPALDLRQGRCVRLRQGRPELETVFSDDPVQMARHWVDSGASWLHIVDLDAALGGESPNRSVVKAIVDSFGIPVQFGGKMIAVDKGVAGLLWCAGRGGQAGLSFAGTDRLAERRGKDHPPGRVSSLVSGNEVHEIFRLDIKPLIRRRNKH